MLYYRRRCWGGGDLTFVHSLNGLDYQLILIDTIDQYDSCDIINGCITSVNLNTCCDDIAVVAHNVNTDTIDEYRSSNGGMDWTDEGTLWYPMRAVLLTGA